MNYPFSYFDNHIVAYINGKSCLIDTGSPISIGEGILKIAGQTHQISNNMFGAASLGDISNQVGVELDFLIGGDILSKHYGLFIWLKKREVIFSGTIRKDAVVNLELFSNVPIICLQINNKLVKAYIDTGARQSYISPSLAFDSIHEGEVSDFYPGYGPMRAPVVSAAYSIENIKNNDNFKFAILPEDLSSLLFMAECNAILGVDWLLDGDCNCFQINYENRNFIND
ncbi:MAG: hypothetical protein PHH52_00595 [Patescibacteria group bacterium]|nr:hypothetical protein [Bacteroidales bacterium]MDD3777867.1 hypothetical protein [Patescibacteria group bacterium]